MILYFSGTGNSRHAAQRMADALGDTPLSMNDRIRSGDTSPVETGERLVIVTPTYAWRIPRLVRDWLLRTELTGAKQAWFVMTCGSEKSVYFSFVTDFNFQPDRKRIYNRCTYSMKSSGYLVSSTTEFSSGMKHRKYDFNCRKS